MAGIIGTIINVKDLYEKKNTTIHFGDVKQTELITLDESRKYVIPVFQREIRWENSHLVTLIADVANKPKFLGNIIFTKNTDGTYEILDGQQRTTIIYMLLLFLSVKYPGKFPVFETCDFSIKSFKGFNDLYKANFDESNLDKTIIEKIDESDDYKQKNRYIELWNYIGECSLLQTVAGAKAFLKNLCKCELNIIINTDAGENGIETFLDVNLKGVKLDCEDIFKGYLCSQDNSSRIHEIWARLKKLDASINPTVVNRRGRVTTKQVYPFMILVEHYFRCKLSKTTEYCDIEFDSDFNLIGEQIVEKTTYASGTHLIATICDASFLYSCLEEIERIMTLISSIVTSIDTSDLYSKYIDEYNQSVSSSKKRIQDNERKVMNNLTKKILLDKDKVPNCILMRYFLDVFMAEKPDKNDFKKIYAVSSAGLMFSLFGGKKELNAVKDLYSSDEWYVNNCKYVKDKLVTQSKGVKTIKISANMAIYGRPDDPQKFRCKSLATIYDFYECTEEAITVKAGLLDQLNAFLNDAETCSLEHFIINDSGKIDYTTSKGVKVEFEYPELVISYRNALLNYIFISKDLNNSLENMPLNEKIKSLTVGKYQEDFNKEKSMFSHTVVDCAKDVFKMPDLEACKDSEEAEKELLSYYKNNFEDDFITYTAKLIEELEL